VLSKEELLNILQKEYGIAATECTVISAAAKGRQRLSHQLIHFAFLHLDIASRPKMDGFTWVPMDEVTNHPYPKTVGAFLAKNI
jgi:A/G-specific adenine glycosylase